MRYLLLLQEGMVTFVSPCLLPMFPVYVSFFAAGEAQKSRALVNALGFVLGFTAVFVVLGAFAGTLGRLLSSHAPLVNIIAGLVTVLLGLSFLGVIHIRFLHRASGMKAAPGNLRFLSSTVFGMVFSVSWTPCVGAFLGSALMMASSRGGVADGIIMLLIYSLGLGMPFVACAILIDRLKGAFDFIKRNYRAVNIASGSFLILIGLLMATGLLGKFLSLMTF